MMTRGIRALLAALTLRISFVAGTNTESEDARSQQDGGGFVSAEVTGQEVGSEEAGDQEVGSESGPHKVVDQKEEEAERTPSREDIAKVALQSAKRIEKKYRAKVTKAYDAVEEANKHLLMQVKNGTRSGVIFTELHDAVDKALVERSAKFKAELNASLEKATSLVEEDKTYLADDKANLKKNRHDHGHVGKKELKALKKRVKEDEQYLEGALEDEEDEEHKTLPAMTTYEMFAKLLAARKAKVSSTVEARVCAVKDACDQLSKATDNVAMAAQVAGENQRISEHQNFITMSWCEDLLFKAQNLERTSLGLVAELYAEAAIDEQRLKVQTNIEEAVAEDKAADRAAERRKTEKRTDAVADAKADIAKMKKIDKDAAEVTTALQEVNRQVNEIDAYIDTLRKREGSRIAHGIIKDATEDIQAKKVSLRKKLDLVLKQLARTGSSEGLDLSKWEGLLKSADSLREGLTEMDSCSHKRRAVFARLRSHLRTYQDHVTGLQLNATEARRAYGQAAHAHVVALKSVGASRSMYVLEQEKADHLDRDLRDTIQDRVEAANEAVSKLRSAIREALEEDSKNQPEPEEAMSLPQPEQALAPRDEAAPTNEAAPEILAAVTSETGRTVLVVLVLVAGISAMVSAVGWTSTSMTTSGHVHLLG